jgi:DNA-binding MarR family transcriptional regulator
MPLFRPSRRWQKKMGVSSTAVRNHARSLEAKGYLRREMQVGSTNRFDLSPLFKALERLQLTQEHQRIDAELDKLSTPLVTS